MAKGPYGVVDWPAGCDPEWSDYNGGCSDYAGNFINTKTGESVLPNVLADILRGVRTITTQELRSTATAPAGTAPAPPAAAPDAPFDPVAWAKRGYNVLYVAAGVVALMAVLSSAGGRRR